jgi:hypothetical protein
MHVPFVKPLHQYYFHYNANRNRIKEINDDKICSAANLTYTATNCTWDGMAWNVTEILDHNDMAVGHFH